MLDIISRSAIRRHILRLFIYNPHKAFYINELARMVGTSAGTTQRELRRLASAGIVARERRGNQVHYFLDKKNPLLKELKAIVQKTFGIEHLLRERFASVPGIDFAFIYGSYAKGRMTNDSDIDVYVLGNAHDADVHTAVDAAESSVGREVNYHLSTVLEFTNKIRASFFHREILKRIVLLNGDPDEFGKLVKRAAQARED
jgi:predicted nucleotidyltransferase